jgi:hypothetical protein
MGSVYLARRIDGLFAQDAAIKLVKRGMDTDAILRRWRRTTCPARYAGESAEQAAVASSNISAPFLMARASSKKDAMSSRVESRSWRREATPRP